MKKFFLTAILGVFVTLSASAWGQKGHDVTASIAEKHLTPAADSLVADLFDGRSIIYWANWLDNASNTPDYRYSKTWHYKNINDGVRYEEMAPNPAGDAILAIKSRMEILTDPASTRDDKVLALKMLVHIVGDIHCPMHMGHATDLGGNRVKLKYFNNDTNLHSVWDGALPEAAHKWSYSEWTDQLDRLTPEQISEIVFPGITDPAEMIYTPGLVDRWAKETLEITGDVYKKMPEGSKLGYDDIAWAAPIIEQQFVRGALRLAFLLNYIAE